MKFSAHSEFNTLLYAVSLQGRFFNTESSRRIRAAGNEEEREEVLLRLIKGVNREFSEQAKKEIALAEEQGISVVSVADEEYPSALLELVDPPLILFVRGKLPVFEAEREKFCFGIIGTRKCTNYGCRAARSIARKLSTQGVCIVSGLAHGIDAAAHRGAVEAAREAHRTVHPGIAVLGSGLNHLYPAANRRLGGDILELGGAIVSEYGLEQRPRKDLFPRRNRIISGLSRGIVVVEAAKKSGSLITARLALEQNRDVFAVPGPIDSEVSQGSNSLLRQGAILLDSYEELQSFYPELEVETEVVSESASKPIGRASNSEQLDGSDVERSILKALQQALQQGSSVDIDELSRITELNTASLLPLLTSLELQGKVELGADRLYVLSSLIDS